MSLVKYSIPLTEIRGSIGGSTFLRNTTGNHVRVKTLIRKNMSTLQKTQRDSFRKCVLSWQEKVTAEERILWSQMAQRYTTTGTLGHKYHLTSWQNFLRINLVRARNNVSITTSPPTDL